ncbi:hypothetical protein N7462_000486 [Penicillium macrosclerotiorum]|uniref:uncharacterized protein n=1 Tax=Penicillium macrosclerotiorum TaxID=303699 RepID=UPI0025499876|nr:uncharacterized protein N7462_000486 [Penicillium macrosclerotiorum]KAJ5698481.1 hypothetical protein N7462_000486 [Penicillium macrosclerotiorum]
MSSGFVSAGTNEEPVERDDAWLKAQQELEEERRRKAEIGQQDGGKSLFEVLQQNKMAKQEQFEEKMRLKNQFRSLDDDEIEFLDSVLESTRAQEATLKKDTADQLEAFRKHREEAEKALLGPTSSEVTPAEDEEWTIPARKRRRDKGKDSLLSGKKRKPSLAQSSEKPSVAKEDEARKSGQEGRLAAGKTGAETTSSTTAPTSAPMTKAAEKATTPTSDSRGPSGDNQPAKPAPISLGLAGYGSDSDSE